jgi:2-phospho-L-lactate guanylyltransferase
VALATGMLTDVLGALRRVRNIDDVVVVTSDPGAEVLARTFGAQVIPDDPQGGHVEAARLGTSWAVDQGAFHVLMLCGDAPLLDPQELDILLHDLADGPEVVVVPDRHGTGTNALLLTPPEVIEPSFGEGSRARHEQLARDAGAVVRVATPASLVLDIDTPADLDALTAALDAAPKDRATHTRDALTRVRRT